ncbi:MAG: DUF4159 domain-containing protein, partial [Thermoguttaceae bacterium]|nr:DUF4159 domain-containing protein [Thermoguttaceae bacterium]
KKFEEAFLQEMAHIFPDDEIVEIPADDELFSGRYGGFKLDGLKYRRRNGDDAGQTLVDGPPELRGVRRDGRWIVVFSPNDVACALENVAAANCEGLAPESARRLATNIIFYAAEAF